VSQNGWSFLVSDSMPSPNFRFTNNIAPDIAYGIIGSNAGPGNDTISRYFADGLFAKNAIAGAPAWEYPAGNLYPTSMDAVGFVNLAGHDYHLLSTSLCKNAATDGGDVGADLEAISAAAAGSLAPVSPPPPPPPPPSSPLPAVDIVIWATDVTTMAGNFTRVASASSPAGQMMSTPNLGWATLQAPLAQPADYFEASFNAIANTPYHVWVRLQAASNGSSNDSVWVQFDSAASDYPIGSSSGLLVNLETCTGCGDSGWGWQDGTWWLDQTTTIQFSTTGLHRIRVQSREDGVKVDQIVLSPRTYLTSAPGSTKNDGTIVPKPGQIRAAATGSQLRVLTWNIFHGFDINLNYVLPAQVDFMLAQSPDVILLEEVQTWDEDQPSVLQKLLQQKTGQAWSAIWAPITDGAGGTQGAMILSRRAATSASYTRLHAGTDYTLLGSNMSAAQMQLTVNNVPLNLFVLHLDNSSDGNRRVQLQQFMGWAAGFTSAQITGGDFNSVYNQSDGVIAAMETANTDTWQDVTGSPSGPFTHDTRKIDYIFRSVFQAPQVTPTATQVVATSLSDHNALVCDFSVNP
jgi:endonuclease/exonuclease/phosphatase family metal-dependent hydrolase